MVGALPQALAQQFLPSIPGMGDSGPLGKLTESFLPGGGGGGNPIANLAKSVLPPGVSDVVDTFTGGGQEEPGPQFVNNDNGDMYTYTAPDGTTISAPDQETLQKLIAELPKNSEEETSVNPYTAHANKLNPDLSSSGSTAQPPAPGAPETLASGNGQEPKSNAYTPGTVQYTWA